jgi:hypothetical protein
MTLLSAETLQLSEPISPELVLVDPSLRRRVLGAHANSAALVRPSPMMSYVGGSGPVDREPQPRVRSAYRVLIDVRETASLFFVVGALAAAGFLIALVITPRSATMRPQRVMGQAISPGAFAPAHALDISAQGQRIAWAPTAGATAYDVEVARNGVPVFVTRRSSTTMLIAIQGQSGASGLALAPGTYNWYVWRVRGDRREGAAIVNSRLVIPPPHGTP